ncbi:hypothetical protein HK099_007944 [Clydaea vesicula]|uniref:C2H2-type domain-containing protein n=1 Tax=Clydaea vesicula TaxID=447962 RepID=A0AAD5U572_9FUNG|nr:hypothetical protein HK099_007944 [Clydaea vesicula]KAJ3384017.1 hypothetical protein HDU92_003803 [Lobulomyces angularis]
MNRINTKLDNKMYQEQFSSKNYKSKVVFGEEDTLLEEKSNFIHSYLAMNVGQSDIALAADEVGAFEYRSYSPLATNGLAYDSYNWNDNFSATGLSQGESLGMLFDDYEATMDIRYKDPPISYNSPTLTYIPNQYFNESGDYENYSKLNYQEADEFTRLSSEFQSDMESNNENSCNGEYGRENLENIIIEPTKEEVRDDFAEEKSNAGGMCSTEPVINNTGDLESVQKIQFNYQQHSHQTIDISSQGDESKQTNASDEVIMHQQSQIEAQYYKQLYYKAQYHLQYQEQRQKSLLAQRHVNELDSFSVSRRVKTQSLDKDAKRKYVCEVCQNRFTRPSTLKTHMNSHTRERPFACESVGCAWRFTVLSNLRRHARICPYRNTSAHAVERTKPLLKSHENLTC